MFSSCRTDSYSIQFSKTLNAAHESSSFLEQFVMTCVKDDFGQPDKASYTTNWQIVVNVIKFPQFHGPNILIISILCCLNMNRKWIFYLGFKYIRHGAASSTTRLILVKRAVSSFNFTLLPIIVIWRKSGLNDLHSIAVDLWGNRKSLNKFKSVVKK